MRFYKFSIVFFFINFSLVANIQYRFSPFKYCYEKQVKKIKFNIENYQIVKEVIFNYSFIDKDSIEDLEFSNIVLKNKGEWFDNVLVFPSQISGKKIKYYFNIILKNQKEILVKQNDFICAITKDNNKPKIIFVNPEDKVYQEKEIQEIKIGLIDKESGINFNSIRFYLNDQDYTRAVELKGNILYIKNKEIFIPGNYSFYIKVQDNAGNFLTSKRYKFKIKKKEIKDINQQKIEKWQGKGTLSLSYSGSLQIENKNSFNIRSYSEKASKSANYNYTLSKKDLSLKIGPISVSNAQSTPGNRPNKISLSLTGDNIETQWGDISGNISSKTLSSSLVGGFFSLKSKKKGSSNSIEIKTAYGQTQTGYDSISGGTTGKFYRNAFGFYSGFTHRLFNIFTAYKFEEDLKNSLINSDGLTPFRYQAVEVGGKVDLKGIKLNIDGNYAISYKERDTENKGIKYGSNFSIKLGYLIPFIKIQTSASYEEGTLNYEGSGSPDQRKISLSFNRSIFSGILSLNNSSSYSINNIARTKPETNTTMSINTGATVSISKWPSLNYSNSISMSEGRIESQVNSSSFSNNNTLGSSYSFTFYKIKNSLNLNLSYVDMINETANADPTGNINMGIKLSYKVDIIKNLNLSLNYGVNQSENKNDGSKTLVNNYGGNININFLKNKITNTFSITRSMNYQINDGLKELSSASISFSGNMSVSLIKSLNFSVNASYAPQGDGTSKIRAYPANFSLGFSLSYTL